MDNINPNKIDMRKERTKAEWNKLLDSVKINNDDVLTKKEQSYYVDEINYKINGQRHSKIEILKSIEESAADIDDIG